MYMIFPFKFSAAKTLTMLMYRLWCKLIWMPSQAFTSHSTQSTDSSEIIKFSHAEQRSSRLTKEKAMSRNLMNTAEIYSVSLFIISWMYSSHMIYIRACPCPWVTIQKHRNAYWRYTVAQKTLCQTTRNSRLIWEITVAWRGRVLKCLRCALLPRKVDNSPSHSFSV